MQNVIQYINENKNNHLNELISFLKFQSISTNPDYNAETRKCADWLASNMKSIGLENVKVIETDGQALVYADWLNAGADKPTLLIYGHYDVQPIDPIELWDSPPFEPVVKDGKIFGRGTADDKGQVFTHVKAVESFLKTEGKLPINIKFIIEGEEESGGEAIADFLPKNKELLACDCILISDTSWITPNMPSITYSLRGISAFEFIIEGPNRDLHSGSYGGAVDNPIHVIADIIAKLHDKYGKIAIPNYYDDIVELTNEERENFKKLPYNENEYKADLNIAETYGENGYTTYERQWARPTLEVNGIYGGYIDKGHKSIIPSKAGAKISLRLVPNQDWQKAAKMAMDYIKSITPPTVKITFTKAHGGNPALAPIDSKGVASAKYALNKAFNMEVALIREGGSIPIITDFQENLNAPAVLMGLGLDSDNIHSPNENFVLENFYGGIRASAYFIENFGS